MGIDLLKRLMSQVTTKIPGAILIVLGFIFLNSMTANAQTVHGRIFGGGVSKSSKSISLLIEGQKGVRGIYVCSGSFLSTTKFLTAKHCVAKNGFRSPSFVILTSAGGTPIKVKRVQKSAALDLAILTVAPAKVNPIPLMLSRAVAIGDPIQFYGYGQDQTQKTAPERSAKTFLKYGSGNVLDIDAAFYYFQNSSSGGACHGDSGGPMVALNADGDAGIIGVANAILSKTNLNKCASGIYSRYTKVTERAALNFIAAFAPEAGVI